ncbi:GNAT family N-acetyltransferase [Hamadaea tsunoensis]|uniref:GNAT family N-acetyltransferase n=1 Tax=Hamadaea tsunoensis TaxID=53368 RepID=UPI002ADD91F0|nr:GNAT family N-acetyltransferase [Hamadaea tsunoensis]
MIIETERLVLRDWLPTDHEPWAAMNADPAVREFLGPPITREQADASIAYFQEALDRNGYGFWAVEVRGTGEFIGFTGLDDVDDFMPFTGVEIGWRLARSAWGRGYATEAARAVLAYGFETLRLPEIFAITTTTNVRSQAVMRRLGMTTDPAEDFDHPEIEEGDPLRRHVLYRIKP